MKLAVFRSGVKRFPSANSPRLSPLYNESSFCGLNRASPSKTGQSLNYRRYALFGLVIGIAIPFIVWLAGGWRSQTPINVLIVSLDTTRADRIGCYGYAGALTPGLDALAKEGVLFERAYATVPLTLPSHAALLTGRYSPENGVHLNGKNRLAHDVPTLGQLLQRAGYATGAFVGAVVLYGRTGLNRGFDVYDDDMAGGERHGHESHLMRKGEIVVDSALSWLQRRANSPFFCWVHLYDPHAPFEGFNELFENRFRDRPYDGDIAYADLQVTRLMNFLKERGIYDRTLVIVVGDHGEGFGEHEELEHGFLLYDSTLRVPLIMKPADAAARGQRISTPVSLVDLFPTVLAAAKQPVPKEISGIDLSSGLQGKAIAAHPCCSETMACYESFRWAPLASVVAGDWKYVSCSQPELYNLASDPGELRNLADQEPQRLDEMHSLLQSVRERMSIVADAEVEHDAKHLRQLQALGYLSGGAVRSDIRKESLPDVKDRIRYYNAEVEARQRLRTAPEESLAEFRRISQEVPDFMPAWVSWGATLQSLNRTDEAVKVYEQALAINPQATEIHFDLAKLLQSTGDQAGAKDHYRQVIEIDPHYAMAHINLASLLADEGEIESARRHFAEGLDNFPDSMVGLFNAGLFHFRLGEFGESIKYLTRAAELDPRHQQIRYQLGLAYEATGDRDEALDQYEAVLRLNPRHARAAERVVKLRAGR